MSDKIPAGEDLVVVRSKKRTTKKKTPALPKKVLDTAVAPSSTLSPVIESESPPVTTSGASLLLSSFRKKEEAPLALSMLLSSGTAGEEDEESIAPVVATPQTQTQQNSIRDEESTSSFSAVSSPSVGVDDHGKDQSTAASNGNINTNNSSSVAKHWKLGEAFKAAWQSTSSKVSAFVLRNSSSVIPDEELQPAASQRETDLRVANYLLRLAVVNMASDAVGIAAQNVRIVRELSAKHVSTLSTTQNDSAIAAANMAKLSLEMQQLKNTVLIKTK